MSVLDAIGFSPEGERELKKVPTITSVKQVASLMKELESIREGYEKVSEQVGEDVSRMSVLRDQLFRRFSRNNRTIRELVAARDRALTLKKDADAEEDPLFKDESRRSARGRVKAVEARAEKFFGRKVDLANLETAALRGRDFSQDELEALAAIEDQGVRVRKSMRDLFKINAAYLKRVQIARLTFEKWADIRFDVIPKMKNGDLQGRIAGAHRKFKKVEKAINGDRTRLARDIRTVDKLVSAVSNVSDPNGTLKMLRNVSLGATFAAGALLTPASVITGALAAAALAFQGLLGIMRAIRRFQAARKG